jgi:RNA-directed DNA polymerase
MRDKHQNIEEPCEKKFSRTVLKTSGTGDSLAEFNRSCHDAINAIYNSIHLKPKYVLDADIAGCFDNIDQEALLTKLNTSPSFTRQIRAWLKAGVIDWSEYSAQRGYSATSRGTPQGGVISPLLANVALHGMEERLKQYAETLTLYSPGGFKLSKSRRRDSVSVIRYADDFVVLHEDIAVIQRCREILSGWLKGIGLELKPSKTHVSHTFVPYEDNVGFDFLGFRIKQFKAGKYNTGNNTHGVPLGFKTIITPSPDKISSHYKSIVKTINAHKSASQEALITKLNPQIRGWANYYQTVNSTDTFKKLDALVWNKLWAWAKRRHPTKGKKYVARKYWQKVGGDNWVFVGRGNKLNKHSQTKIKDYTMVKGEASPYNGNLVYWSTRRGYSPEMPSRVSKLLKEQQGKCAYCGHHFREDDLMEVHRIVPGKEGGKYKKGNMRLLHRHCHDKEHGNDGQDSITSLNLLE